MRVPFGGSRIAALCANLLILIAIACASMGLWRMAADLDWAGDFVFQSGLLSHWQVWIAAAVGVQYVSWRLAERLPEVLDTARTGFSTLFGDRLLKAIGQTRKVWSAVLMFPACSTSGPFGAGSRQFLNVRTNAAHTARIRRDQGGRRASPRLRSMGVLHARNR